MTFLKELAKNLKNPYKENQSRPYLVIDNHAAHKSKKVTMFMETYFKPIWLPAYSCEFNSIESYWSRLKSEYR